MYSVDYDGIMKIWYFNILNSNILQLRQTISILGNVWGDANEALFVWNNGAKLFIGSDNDQVKIYTLNVSNNLYLITPEVTPTTGDRIYSVWVNVNGDKIYVATWVGCKLIIQSGGGWIVNPPSSISSILGAQSSLYIRLMNN